MHGYDIRYHELTRGRIPHHRFDLMNVGDFFDVPRDLGTTKYGQDRRQVYVGRSARHYVNNHAPTAAFKTKASPDSIRCTRVK